jgi:hypothetical protein
MGLIFRNKGPEPMPEPVEWTDEDEDREAEQEEIEWRRRLRLENYALLRSLVTDLPEYDRDTICQLCGYDRATTTATNVICLSGRIASLQRWRNSLLTMDPISVKVLCRDCPNCKNSWWEKPLNWEEWMKGFKNEQQ